MDFAIPIVIQDFFGISVLFIFTIFLGAYFSSNWFILFKNSGSEILGSLEAMLSSFCQSLLIISFLNAVSLKFLKFLFQCIFYQIFEYFVYMEIEKIVPNGLKWKLLIHTVRIVIVFIKEYVIY